MQKLEIKLILRGALVLLFGHMQLEYMSTYYVLSGADLLGQIAALHCAEV